MLSLMFGLGVISRMAFGFITDWIGPAWALFIGSLLQAVSLLLYLPADDIVSLYLVSALFGLFQENYLAYAVIIRQYYPASQAGVRRISFVCNNRWNGLWRLVFW